MVNYASRMSPDESGALWLCSLTTNNGRPPPAEITGWSDAIIGDLRDWTYFGI